MRSISDAIIEAFKATSTTKKVTLTHDAAKAWFAGKLSTEFNQPPPNRPGRPDKPELWLPQNMPRRRKAKSRASRIAMLHAIAHIELNAIDLALDIVARFGNNMPNEFIDDWIKVADDEARHFKMIDNLLIENDSFYGALPAHDGLWQSAENTMHDLLARLAIVPLVLEARGLDVTPAIIEKFKNSNDHESVAVLDIIYNDEIDHVRAGQKWFNILCNQKNLNPEDTYQELVNQYFTGKLKPPFNIKARSAAGFSESYYMPLTKSVNHTRK